MGRSRFFRLRRVTAPCPTTRDSIQSIGYASPCVSTHQQKSHTGLCQDCVTYPPKPWGNTVIYEDTSTHIDVAEVVESEVRWWDLVCVSTREEIQFPSVLLKPLGHLSPRLATLVRGRPLWNQRITSGLTLIMAHAIEVAESCSNTFLISAL
jgi:hypothetical protein